MTKEIVIKNILENGDLVETGRQFFACSLEEIKDILLYLLKEQRFNQLTEIIECSLISKQYETSRYFARESSSLQSQYFCFTLELTERVGISEETLYPYVFSVFSAPQGSKRFGYIAAASSYICKKGYEDYDAMFTASIAFDKTSQSLDVLMQVDSGKTMDGVLDLLVYEKGINKPLYRKFLLRYKVDVLSYFSDSYAKAKLDVRVAIVRLLLLYKNDYNISIFLANLKSSEKSKIIKRILDKDGGIAESAKNTETDGVSREEYFTNLIITGEELSLNQFNKLLTNEYDEKFVNSLFFSVYSEAAMTGIVIVDNGKVLDLDNNPKSLPDNAIIKVLHPVELSGKYQYLKQLKIAQPLLQIHRPVYFPQELEIKSNCFSRQAGSVIGVGEFKERLKQTGFKILSRDNNNDARNAGKQFGEVFCVVDFGASNLKNDKGIINFGVVRFYRYNEIIKLKKQMYVEGARVMAVSELEQRVYSESIYSVYTLLGQI